MGRNICTLFLGAACAVTTMPLHAAVPHRSNVETIRYATEACFGNCPVYVLTVRSNGAATFDGQRYTVVKGIRNFRISAEQFASFRASLAPYRPRGERSLDGSEDCNGNVATDQPSVDVTWTGGGSRSHLNAYFGCDMDRNGHMFDELARAPDSLPQVKAFIRKR